MITYGLHPKKYISCTNNTLMVSSVRHTIPYSNEEMFNEDIRIQYRNNITILNISDFIIYVEPSLHIHTILASIQLSLRCRTVFSTLLQWKFMNFLGLESFFLSPSKSFTRSSMHLHPQPPSLNFRISIDKRIHMCLYISSTHSQCRIFIKPQPKIEPQKNNFHTIYLY